MNHLLNNPLLETYRVVTLSTSHMTRADDEALGRNGYDIQLPMGVACHDYGYIVSTNADNEGDEDERARYLSRELIQVLDWARETGFRWFEFDRDAPCVDGLPTFEW